MKNVQDRKSTNGFSNKIKNIFTLENFKKFLFGSSTGRKMFRLYFLILLLSAILLYLPISFNQFFEYGYGEQFNYINNAYEIHLEDGTIMRFNFFDCLFMSFSAFSDTGLSLFSISSVFSIYGKIILMITIQVGGFGVMFFIFLFWKIFLRSDKLSVNQTLLAQYEKGNTKVGNTDKMLVTSSLIIITLEILFAFFYSLWFLLVPSYEQVQVPNAEHLPIYIDSPDGVYSSVYHNPSEAFFAGFFHSVSVVNNAGFDILGSNSLSAFKNGVHTIFLFVTAFQFILGGIGFPVIFDILSKWKIVREKKYVLDEKKCKVKKTILHVVKDSNHKLSLFSKLTLSTYFIVAAFGILFIFIFEATPVGGGHNYIWEDKYMFGEYGTTLSWYNKSINLIFQTLSTRSAGYCTFDNSLLNTMSKWLNIALMFIGGSASSTAGGIRVTTLAIIAIVIFKKIKGSKRVSIFKRNLAGTDILNSFIVLTISIILVAIGGVVILSNVENAYNYDDLGNTYFTDAIFMCTSAFGTTGLSVINIDYLDWWSLLYLMILMFIGQYGVSTTILAIRRSKVKENLFNYVTESVRIG